MQKGQPIWFNYKGSKKYGIVKEIMADRAGVEAVIRTSSGQYIQVEVPEPHRVRDPEEARLVFEQMGYEKIATQKEKATPPAPAIPDKLLSVDDFNKLLNAHDLATLKFLGSAFQPLDEPEKKE